MAQKYSLIFLAATPIVLLRHGLSPACAGNQRLECSTLIHMFNSQTCLNSQPAAIGAYFGLKSWRQDGTARVIITSARFACVTGALKHQHAILRGDVGAS